MTRLFLAAGVAALAMTAPAAAKPGGGHGGGHDRGGAQVSHGGGGGHGQRAEARQQRRGGGGQAMQRAQRLERASAQRAQRTERVARANRAERRQVRVADRQHGQAKHAQRAQNRVAERQQIRADRKARNAVAQREQRQFNRNQNRLAQREQRQFERANRVQQRVAAREQFRDNRIALRDLRADRNRGFDRAFADNRIGYGVGGCPPGLAAKGCMPPGQARKLLGEPIAAATRIAGLSALPASVSYLYPATDDYYYRYGDGYAYRVNRDNNLINALIPLIAGGYMPGSYLPASYMNNYVPSYYGFNNFYPDSPYSCNRYEYGVVYQVDCATGYVEDVIPLYASGYGVGQMLPASYGYYNVPYQYRDLYYNTDDYNYWYAPGAIYQYDPGTSLITSVAALLSPGFTVGQPLPAGYGVYNVPYGYRSTYYDTPNAWYRYNNGYIYQVDPTTQLVTAIVASILT